MVRPFPGDSLVADTSVDATKEVRLLQKALAGDGAAFATLVEPHLDLLYRIAGRAAGSAALAEDAVQEALEIVHKRLGRYEAGTSFKAFIASIAVRRARTLLRAELRRSRRESATPDAAHPATPAELFVAEETAGRIRAALAALPEKRQRVVLLRLDAGLGYAEIAAAVGTTEGSARVLVHHALRDLHETLSDLVNAPSAKPERTES
ncbi:MAG TPA: sigma-70 family RNA polymerase sigma factor [Polyangiaceae bacterium]|jgi:RNA polymerase sigma-70 factor (ECF subfamily)|nr:sigma-70 family RNA polymerase sigma factor [Polyangiaceae bacterium]